jgi:peptide-methionine (S)-S-oxide reductase
MGGVVRTRVGYAGGKKPYPTYRSLGDHAETIQIDYDPAIISYRQLLDVFWSSHDPASRSWSTQYKAVIFYHNEEQQRLAIETRDRLSERLGTKVHTEIIPYSTFYVAEDYHQKYRLRGNADFLREVKAVYPDDTDIMNSTAAARLNGYLAGYGSLEEVRKQSPSLGLSPESQARLLKMVERRPRG